jgi:alkylation response protein AidB-like acyl-CoA dehydrogenase
MLQEIKVKETNGHRLENFTNGARVSVATIAKQLGPRFAERAARADEEDLFVAENFGDLKTQGLLAAGVPQELGGGDASHAELSDMLRELGHYCGSTALAFPCTRIKAASKSTG